MSATNRGTVRAAFDTYPTPSWCTRRLLEAWRGAAGPRTVLEPCAGDGAIVRVVHALCLGAHIIAVDIRPEATCGGPYANAIIPGIDMLAIAPADWGRYDLVITNPPFRQADAFVERSVAAGTHAALLLPFQRLADGHAAFFQRVGLPELFVLPDRPSFVATTRCKTRPQVECKAWGHFTAPESPERVRTCPHCGGPTTRGTQDVNCYAWFTWGPTCTPGRYSYLAPTPLAERRAG